MKIDYAKSSVAVTVSAGVTTTHAFSSTACNTIAMANDPVTELDMDSRYYHHSNYSVTVDHAEDGASLATIATNGTSSSITTTAEVPYNDY